MTGELSTPALTCGASFKSGHSGESGLCLALSQGALSAHSVKLNSWQATLLQQTEGRGVHPLKASPSCGCTEHRPAILTAHLHPCGLVTLSTHLDHSTYRRFFHIYPLPGGHEAMSSRTVRVRTSRPPEFSLHLPLVGR